MQRNCIFPGRYAPLTYYDWLRGRPRNTLTPGKYAISLNKSIAHEHTDYTL